MSMDEGNHFSSSGPCARLPFTLHTTTTPNWCKIDVNGLLAVKGKTCLTPHWWKFVALNI